MGDRSMHPTNYDVFLSYKPEDTGRNFTSNLYNALRHKRIKTAFLVPENDDDGDQLSPAIREAIQGSKISMVILSQNYASSLQCLNELVKILECKTINKQRVLPIFYNVHPSHVRHLQHKFGEAMSKLAERFQDGPDRVLRWREALVDVCHLRGLHCGYGEGYEFKFIQDIVESTLKSLPRYDVFLSFSGEDTRYSFTGFLYQALRRGGFKTFMDDEGLEGGNQISETLLKAIEKSRLSIVVFSENYGYSSWCLDELVKIVECKKTENQLVWPIFYKVKQSDVSNQTKSFGDAMIAHENRFGKNSEKVQKWKSALSEVAFWEGDHITENKYEHEFIKKIVKKAIDVENHF